MMAGRPEVGQAINVRLGDDRLKVLDGYAFALRISRAEALRRAVDTWLGDPAVMEQVTAQLRETQVSGSQLVQPHGHSMRS